MLKSLLIANRGEIARRIIRTARRMGIRTVAVVTAADRTWPHWREADHFVAIGEGPASESYLSIERVIAAALKSGADAVHPGYGFLSENADFAEAVAAAGLTFVGPPASAIRTMGSKAEAKRMMALAGVQVVPGYGGERQEPYFLKQKAYEIGYPVLIKAVAGGGGRGMRTVSKAVEFDDALESARREALSSFGDDQVLIERLIERARHIEVQVFADRHGNVVHLGERDCSIQRRHQKVVEEAPAPGVGEDLRRALGAAAVKAALSVGYEGAGTVEFIADASKPLARDNFFFIEMNTRLQVEHPVTEMVTGLDLVEWQLRVAAGEPLPLGQDEIVLNGHALEARIYAEDPAEEFRPSTGKLLHAAFPQGAGIRIDSGVDAGTIVSPYYDAMLAKIIVAGVDRNEAMTRFAAALGEVRIAGPQTNLGFLASIVDAPEFRAGGADTGFVDRELDRLAGTPLEPALAAAAVNEWVKRRADEIACDGPWGRTDSFELGGVSRTTALDVEIDGEPMIASLAWSAAGPKVESISGSPADGDPPGTIDVLWNGREAIVLYRHRQMRVVIPNPLARSLDEVASTGDVVAPITGRVVAVLVQEGMKVAKGDPLFSLEAMKMEHGVVSPMAGRVTAIRVAEGGQVEQGTVALTIAAEE